MEYGENLTSYPNIDVFEAKTAAGLKDLLTQIRLPHKIISIYHASGRHYAWVSLTIPIKKKVTKRRSIKKINEQE